MININLQSQEAQKTSCGTERSVSGDNIVKMLKKKKIKKNESSKRKMTTRVQRNNSKIND